MLCSGPALRQASAVTPAHFNFRQFSFVATALLLVAFIFAATTVRAQEEPPLDEGNAAPAQEEQIINKGDMAVSGFSGTSFPAEGLAPGADPLDETFIDTEGASVRIFKVGALGDAAKGQEVHTPDPFEVKASQVGQVFGLAFDDGKRDGALGLVANLYATATSLFGLQIVKPDADGDGRPERLKSGEPGAVFMEGQFGNELGGTPGAIYKIDGQTGEVSLFANVETDGQPNAGPGLGNIAFDKVSRQLFVSDLDTGLIHRFNLDGEDQGQFDHGVNGRPKKGLPEVADDGQRMDITNPAFKADDPMTWGFTQKERRVWGLGVHGRRLYYAVEDGLQIWSVGITHDGDFADDARWELDVRSDTDFPVTDIAFDNKGFMYLAQRGTLKSPYDYGTFAEPAKAQVLRYYRESPDDPATPSVWVETPEEYAVGFPEGNRMAVGGLDVQYRYDETGALDFGGCTLTIVKTGDDLRNDPELADKLAEGGALHIHGVQITAIDLVRPKNVPPWNSYFLDYDRQYDDPEVRGHVGDVEVFRPCEGKLGLGEYTPYPGGDIPPLAGCPGCPPPPDCPDCPPPAPKCIEVEDILYSCGPGGTLIASIYAKDKLGLGADSLRVSSQTPGVTVSPPIQTAAPGDPFEIEISGALPGETVTLGMCVHNSANAEPGKPYQCCCAQIELVTPVEACTP